MITTHTTHELQVGENGTWAPAQAGMYDSANLAARLGDLTKAISLATEIRHENYGVENSRGIEFRVVTTTITEFTH